MNIAIFASGAGSNVKNIIEYFKNDSKVQIQCVWSNKTSAGALDHAKEAKIDTLIFNKQQIEDADNLITVLHKNNIELIVLAGFLLKIPPKFIKNFNGKIINVHPSLLPKYGGKGMYGNNVHNKVLKSGDKETGITIHYVNENYDEGKIISQFKTEINNNETIDSLLLKIKGLEKQHYPYVIKQTIINNKIK